MPVAATVSVLPSYLPLAGWLGRREEREGASINWHERQWRRQAVRVTGLAVGETVSLLTLSLHRCWYTHCKVERGAAE